MLQLQPVMYKQQYLMLVEFCLFECDIVSLCLPNLEEVRCDGFRTYKKNAQPILDMFEPNLIFSEQTNHYVGEELEYPNEVYYYNTLGLSNEPFNMVESIYDWRYPDFPEDLCFFKGEICWFKSIAHENMAFIYDDSQETKGHLTWLGFHYLEDEAYEPPRRATFDT